MNIKVTDLRVGNKVYGVRNANLKEIVEVGKILWQEIITSIDDGARCFRVEDEVEGIPLSSDILEKCGFDKSESDHPDRKDTYFYQIENNYSLYYCEKNDEWFISYQWNDFHVQGKFWKQPKYVHELQNLIASLAGEELTVNL